MPAGAEQFAGAKLAFLVQRKGFGLGIRHALDTLKRDGNTKSARDRMLSFKDYNEALKLDEIVEWEGKYLPPAG